MAKRKTTRKQKPCKRISREPRQATKLARTTGGSRLATTVARTVAESTATGGAPAFQAPLMIPDTVESSFIQELRKRLGHRAFVSISLVATACDVSVMTVQSWREAGLIEAANVSATPKPYYRIFAPSVLRYFERRLSLI